MSEWINIEDPDDVEVLDDTLIIAVLFETNDWGSIEIPLAFIFDAISKKLKESK